MMRLTALSPVALSLLWGCDALRNPSPPGPDADTARSGRWVAPVRDAADDPNTVSPVETSSSPGNAGALRPGLSEQGAAFSPASDSIGTSAEELGRQRAADDGDFSDLRLGRRQAAQRAQLEERRAFQEGGRLGAGTGSAASER